MVTATQRSWFYWPVKEHKSNVIKCCKLSVWQATNNQDVSVILEDWNDQKENQKREEINHIVSISELWCQRADLQINILCWESSASCFHSFILFIFIVSKVRISQRAIKSEQFTFRVKTFPGLCRYWFVFCCRVLLEARGRKVNGWVSLHSSFLTTQKWHTFKQLIYSPACWDAVVAD